MKHVHSVTRAGLLVRPHSHVSVCEYKGSVIVQGTIRTRWPVFLHLPQASLSSPSYSCPHLRFSKFLFLSFLFPSQLFSHLVDLMSGTFNSSFYFCFKTTHLILLPFHTLSSTTSVRQALCTYLERPHPDLSRWSPTVTDMWTRHQPCVDPAHEKYVKGVWCWERKQLDSVGCQQRKDRHVDRGNATYKNLLDRIH